MNKNERAYAGRVTVEPAADVVRLVTRDDECWLVDVAGVDQISIELDVEGGNRVICIEGRKIPPPLGQLTQPRELAQEAEDLREVVHMRRERASKDPWAGRSQGMRCSSCVFYVEKKRTGDALLTGKEVGRCRRHAPTMSGYPVVFPTDWCGDHKLDEEKL